MLLGQQVPGGTGAILPFVQVDWIQVIFVQFGVNLYLFEHRDLFGQHFPSGTGAIWPSGHRSTIQRTFEQFLIKHCSLFGQH